MAGARGSRATAAGGSGKRPAATSAVRKAGGAAATARKPAGATASARTPQSRGGAARKPAAQRPTPAQRPTAKRRPAGETARRRPGSAAQRQRDRDRAWWQRLAVACALLAALGALVGVVISTSGSNRVQERTVVLDVRSAEEFAAGHLEDAVHLDAGAPDFAERVAALDPEAEYIVYCRTGRRAQTVVDHLTSLGFTDVTNAQTLRLAAWTTGLDVVQ